MIYWSYMVLIDLLIPAILFFTGMVYRKHPPRAVNNLWGYRTNRSTKNQDTWEFANRYMGNIWYRWGMILLPLSVVPMLFVLGGDTGVIEIVTGVTCLSQLVPVGASIYLTEKALKEKFTAEGLRKDPSRQEA